MANKKQFTLVFDATMDVSEVKKSISEMQKALNGVNMSKGMTSSVASTFKKLLDELDNYGTITSQVATSMDDIKKADRSLQTILGLFEKINGIAKEIGAEPVNFVDQEDLKRINAAKKALEGAKAALSNTAIAAKRANLQQQFDVAEKKAKGLNDEVSQLNKEIEGKKNKKIALTNQLQDAKDKLSEFKKELNNLQSNPVKAKSRTFTKDGVRTTEILNASEVEEYKNKVADVKREIAKAEETIDQFKKDIATTDTSKAEKDLADLEKCAKEATDSMLSLGERLKHLKKDTKTEAIEKLRNELADLTGLAKKDIPNTIDKLEEFVQGLEDVKKVEVQKAVERLNKELEETGRQGRAAGEGLNKTTREAEALSRTAQDIENLKNQILNFFSISNSIELFKRAVNSAVETVKELDAVMTETAVVTDFSIGDMWDKLPQYSVEASRLGASISDLYGATTLYYQQGLKTNAAMGVGVETMKMARIANMDAEKATTAMTAALRGFNMEVNEMSAQRVNDVYSELAAITAADTSQIATAMGKTASIAASANMEFETTAALLAQIIETTQEAPETAGTALKTIVARFSEVKSLQNKGMTTGKDTEGEDIDVNKIQTALRSVGISMDEFFAGTEGLDSVLLKLAEKWDTLDFTTQRYIATTAAGSRQQSRFIAMMSNYERTMELVGAANDSAGASQKQFDKTTESLKSKLQKLENAWKSFVMGIANDEIVKFGVDALTKILETVNKITDAISGGSGLLKSVANLGLAWGGLKIGGSLLGNMTSKWAMNILRMAPENSEAAGIAQAVIEKHMTERGGFGKIIGNFFKDIGENHTADQIPGKLKDGFNGLKESISKTRTEAKNLFNDLKAGTSESAKLLETKLTGAVTTAAYVAAIALLIAGIKKIADAHKKAKNANEDAVNAMKKAAGEFATQLQEARSELESIADSHNDLNNLQNDLKDLTKGTADWKRKLIEVNTQVLELVEKYPELMGYLSRGSEGQLIVADKGWDVAAAGAEARYQSAAAGQINANIGKIEAQKQMELEQAQTGAVQAQYFRDELFGSNEFKTGMMKGGAALGTAAGTAAGAALALKFAALGSFAGPVGTLVGAGLGLVAGAVLGRGVGELHDTFTPEEEKITRRETGLSQDDYMKFAAAAAEAGLSRAGGSDGGEYEELFKSLGLESDGNFETLWNNIKKLGTDFDELSQSALSMQTAQEAYVDALISQIADFDSGVANSQYREQIESVTSTLNEGLEDVKATEAEALANDRSYVDKHGEATDKLIQEYADINKMTTDAVRAQIADSALSTETMVLSVASGKVDEELLKQMKSLEKTFSKLGMSDGSVWRALSKEGNDIVREDLSKLEEKIESGPLSSITNEEEQQSYVREFLAEYGNMNTNELNSFMKSGAWKTFWDNMVLASEAFADAADVASKMNLNIAGISKLSAGAQKGLLKTLQQQVDQGSTGAQDILNAIISSMADKSLNQQEDFINYLTNTNWDDINSINNLEESLTILFGSSEDGIAKIETLTTAIKDFAKSAIEISDELYRQNVVGRHELIKRIKSGDKAFFTEEEKKLFGEDIQKRMQWTPEGYVYLGEGGNEALIKNLRDQSEKEAESPYAQGKEWKRVLQESGSAYKQEATTEGLSWENLGEFESDDLAKIWSNIGEKSTLESFGTLTSNGMALEAIKGSLSSDVEEDKVAIKALQSWLSEIAPEADFSDEKDITEWYSKLSPSQTAAVAYAASQFANHGSQTWMDVFEDRGGLVYQKSFSYENELDLLKGIAQGTHDYQGYKLEGKKLDELYYKYFEEGTAETYEEKIAALKQVYDEIVSVDMFNADRYGSYLASQGYEEVFRALNQGTSDQKQVAYKVWESYINSLSGISEAIEQWSEDPSIRATDKILQLLAMRLEETAGEATELANAINSNQKALEQGESAGLAYYQALEEIARAMEFVFNDDISLNAVSELRDEILALAQGGEAAANAMRSIGKYLTTKNLGFTDESADWLGKQLSGKTGTFNVEEIVKTLLAQGHSEEEIRQAFSAYGYELAMSGVSYQELQEKILVDRKGHITMTSIGGDWRVGQAVATQNGLTTILSDILGGNESKWENPYDEFYNDVQKINAELRERERLEREYQRLISRTGATIQDVIDNRNDRKTALENELNWRNTLLDDRLAQGTALNKEYAAYKKYFYWDEKNGRPVIDWDEINKIDDQETADAVQKGIAAMEEVQSQAEKETDAIRNIEDELYDLSQEGKEEYLGLEEQIKNAIIDARQEEIDKLVAIDNSINETNSKILASMQAAIAQRRQERDNEKTEQELTDKRRRLMYLQMDTSNANDLEVLKLQKEIAEGEEDYTDQLIDQKISELQDQNDKAAEQRQEQIEIMRAQLEYYQKYDVWQEVSDLITEGIDNNGIIEGSPLWNLLTSTDEYQSASELGKEEYLQEWYERILAAISWKKNNGTQFVTGGLASFTGPAWLDGTKSKPEYVLNASQTQAFLSLVDVLEHFDRGFGNTSTENFGDNIIDIDINIETVKEEADVDMLAEKVEQSILKSARYRNNSFIQR